MKSAEKIRSLLDFLSDNQIDSISFKLRRNNSESYYVCTCKRDGGGSDRLVDCQIETMPTLCAGKVFLAERPTRNQ